MDYVNRDVDNGVELAFHQGDIAYADGDPRVWDTFMDGIEPYASRVPYMVRLEAMCHVSVLSIYILNMFIIMIQMPPCSHLL